VLRGASCEDWKSALILCLILIHLSIGREDVTGEWLQDGRWAGGIFTGGRKNRRDTSTMMQFCLVL
jgi:hypothetical protein